MKKISALCAFTLLFSIGTNVTASQEGFHSLKTREGVEQPLWIIEPESPTHIVILFAGGKGKLNIDVDGIGRTGNFLVRSRRLFASNKFVVVVVDKPSDMNKLYYFRKTEAHAEDIRQVMNFVRSRHPAKPVWLVGTSRGTISAANIAARINGKGSANGLVLTSSVTNKTVKNYDSVYDINLRDIKIPTLVVHHENDDCIVTPFQGAKMLIEELSSANVKELMIFSGGTDRGDSCKAKGYHGFNGIEEQVIDDMAKWIRQH